MRVAKMVLTRIDLAAMVVTLLGLCLAFGVTVVEAVGDFARLVLGLWSNLGNRGFVVLITLAMIWLAVRWRQINRS